jgi:polysaccharide biosynthesis protein PslH
VGRHPPPSMRALAEADPAIRVTGGVPDVRPYIERAAVFVVPIRVGGGTRLKIYEAMAMECPVVSTTVGAEGLPLHDGRDVLLADGARAFADATVALLTRPERAVALAREAAAMVRARFGWESVASQFAADCAAVIEASGRGEAPRRVRVRAAETNV